MAEASTLAKLIARLSETKPQNWCLIAPDGQCYIGPDPLALAARATYTQPAVSATTLLWPQQDRQGEV